MDLDDWNVLKKSISKKTKFATFNEREIWWVRQGVNVGSEQFGKGDNFIRPFLVFRKITSNLFLGIPLTSKKENEQRLKIKYYTEIEMKDSKNLLCFNQIKVVDARRLLKIKETVNENSFKKVISDFIKIYTPAKAGGVVACANCNNIITH
jgi:mRNA-degrading endonuclease toxin of MazEF toxin-antitoxin module